MVLLLAALALRVTAEAPQGGVIHIDEAPESAATAALGASPAVRLFPAPDGTRHGLVPVNHNVAPGEYKLTLRGPDGKPVHTATVQVLDARFLTQNILATRAMKSLKPAPGEMETMRAFQTSVTEQNLREENFAPPVTSCVNSPFGVTRLHNGKPTGNYHRGLDQASRAGAPIHAAASGRVKVARMWTMHGGTVGIDHGQGLTSHYLHMSRVIAKEGQLVRQGDVIGLVGSTGFATGPHLHWGIYLFSVPLNPRLWVPELKSCRE